MVMVGNVRELEGEERGWAGWGRAFLFFAFCRGVLHLVCASSVDAKTVVTVSGRLHTLGSRAQKTTASRGEKRASRVEWSGGKAP